MTTLVKHHFSTIDIASYIMIPLLIIVGYLGRVPPMFLFSVTVISMPIIIYYLNIRDNVERFLTSLPVSTLSIVSSQYVFSVLISLIILALQSMLMIMTYVFLGDILYVYDWRDILILISISLIVPSIAIPIYQGIKSFAYATTVIGILYMGGILFTLPLLTNVLNMEYYVNFNELDIGVSTVIETYIPFQPYPVLLIGSLLLFFGSLFLSHRIYVTTDHGS